MNTTSTPQPNSAANAPETKPGLKPGEGWQIFFILLLLSLPFFIGSTIYTRTKINNYQTNGVVVEATITDAERTIQRRFTSYDIEVMFFPKDSLALESATISNLINNKIWKSLEDKEDVVYLPEAPTEKVLLAKSLEYSNQSPLVKGWVTYGVAGFTLLSYIMMKLRRRQSGK